jgi:hypothetical protein
MAGRELDTLSLNDALALTRLIREADRRRYERAAVRWLERFIQERAPTLAGVALAATALSQLDGVGDQAFGNVTRAETRPNSADGKAPKATSRRLRGVGSEPPFEGRKPWP